MKAGIPGPVSTLLSDINIITIVFVDNCLLGIAFEIFLTFYFFFYLGCFKYIENWTLEQKLFINQAGFEIKYLIWIREG